MPNHITNKLVVEGGREELLKFEIECQGEETPLDFEKIIPTPEQLKGFDPSMNVVYAVEIKYELQKPYGDYLKLSAEEQSDFDQGCKNYEELGCIYWYDWRNKHWGTKWNAYDTSKSDHVDHLEIIFNTPWSPPLPVFEALAEKYPELHLRMEFSDEEAGCGVGKITAEDGGVALELFEDFSNEAYEKSFELGAADKSHYVIKNGQYVYWEDAIDEMGM